MLILLRWWCLCPEELQALFAGVPGQVLRREGLLRGGWHCQGKFKCPAVGTSTRKTPGSNPGPATC